MELFDHQDNNTICLCADNQNEIDRLNNCFYNHYNANYLKEYLEDIFPYLQHITIVRNGMPVPRSEFFPSGKKVYAYRKDECSKLLALVHSHESNLEYLLGQLPKYVSQAILAMLSFGYASEETLNIFDASKAIVHNDKDYYYYYSNPKMAKYMGIFCSVYSISRTDYTEQYLYIPDFLRYIYSRVLLPHITFQAMFSEEPQQGLAKLCAEKEFISAFPVITGMHRQDAINCSGMKIGSVVAAKVFKCTNIQEIIPEDIRKQQKINLGQYFIPSLLQVLDKRKSGNVENYVKDAFAYLTYTIPGIMLPAFLPHIKGFRSKYLEGSGRLYWGQFIKECLEYAPDKWMSLEGLLDYVYTAPGNAFYGCQLAHFRDMNIRNAITGELTYPDTQWEEIDLEYVRALAAAMYALGIVEIAVDTHDMGYTSPAGRIRQIRLTELGKYAIGLSDKYVSQSIVSKDWFRLDPDHLIVFSTSENNPYESLLAEIATPIGGGRFKIDSGSFLKKCRTLSDVKEKISFFKDYISSDLPDIWKDFFENLKKHCNPLTKEKEDYIVLKINGDNPALVRLLTSSSQLRKMILLVEGQRFLIKKDAMKQFVDIMKDKGFLL